MISYAQHFEDVFLNRLFGTIEKGFYVDLGASDPVHASVTKHFYDLGWSGINVEPSCSFEKLVAQRDRDLNLRMCVGGERATITFYERPHVPGLSTKFEPEALDIPSVDTSVVEIQVRQETLESILDHYAGGREVHFLKIDVEGAETEVIRTTDWNRHRPIAMLIEAVTPKQVPSHEDWEPILLANGYLFAYFDGVNRFYVRKENSELLRHFAIPINPFDHVIPYSAIQPREESGRLQAEWATEKAALQQQLAALQDQLAESQAGLEQANAKMENLKLTIQTLREKMAKRDTRLAKTFKKYRLPEGPWSLGMGMSFARFLRRFEKEGDRKAKLDEMISRLSGKSPGSQD